MPEAELCVSMLLMLFANGFTTQTFAPPLKTKVFRPPHNLYNISYLERFWYTTRTEGLVSTNEDCLRFRLESPSQQGSGIFFFMIKFTGLQSCNRNSSSTHRKFIDAIIKS
jgi:hypothetical protein